MGGLPTQALALARLYSTSTGTVTRSPMCLRSVLPRLRTFTATLNAPPLTAALPGPEPLMRNAMERPPVTASEGHARHTFWHV